LHQRTPEEDLWRPSLTCDNLWKKRPVKKPKVIAAVVVMAVIAQNHIDAYTQTAPAALPLRHSMGDWEWVWKRVSE